MDQATVGETLFGDSMAHGRVVLVSVDTQGVVASECKADDMVKNAVTVPAACDTVDRGVGTVVGPLPVVDDSLGRIDSASKDKGGYGPSFRETDEAVAMRYVLANQFLGRIALRPLVGIAFVCHKLAGVAEYLLHTGNVLLRSQSDLHGMVCCFHSLLLFAFLSTRIYVSRAFIQEEYND